MLFRSPAVAEKCLLKAASVNKQDTVTRAMLADYYMSQNQLEKAGRHYLQILSLSSRYFDQAMVLGERLLQKGDRDMAIDIFSKIVTLSRKQSGLREKIIDICMAHDEIEFPVQLLEQSIRENPSNYDVLYKAGQINLELGNREKALAYFLEVDRQARGHVEAKIQIAKIYFMDRKIIQADDYLNQILRIDPKNKEIGRASCRERV